MSKKYFSIFVMSIFLASSLNSQAAEKTSFLGTPYKIFAAGAALGTVFGVVLGWTANKKFAAEHQATNNQWQESYKKLLSEYTATRTAKVKMSKTVREFKTSNLALANLNHGLHTQRDNMHSDLVAARAQLTTELCINCGSGLSAMATQERTVKTPATSAVPTRQKGVRFAEDLSPNMPS